jgi:hypothetical protein
MSEFRPADTSGGLFARSQERIRVFEMQVLSEYARFLEDRAPVEAAYTLNADG